MRSLFMVDSPSASVSAEWETHFRRCIHVDRVSLPRFSSASLEETARFRVACIVDDRVSLS